MHSSCANAGVDEARFSPANNNDDGGLSPMLPQGPPCGGGAAAAAASSQQQSPSTHRADSAQPAASKRRWPCLLKRQPTATSSIVAGPDHHHYAHPTNHRGSSGSGSGSGPCLFSGARIKKRVRISEAQIPPASYAVSVEATEEIACDDQGGAPPGGAAMTDEEKMAAWWSAKDFSEVKDEVKRQCKHHRQDQRYSDCLTDAYQSACFVAAAAAASGGGTDDGWGALVYNNSPANQMRESLPSFPDETMARQLTDERAPRGLEVYSSRLHAMRRQRHLQESKHAVFLEQARQQSHNFRDADLLACQARRASRWARSFATLLGRADAWAVATATDAEDEGVQAAVAVPPADAPTDNSSPSTLNDDMEESAACDPSCSR